MRVFVFLFSQKKNVLNCWRKLLSIRVATTALLIALFAIYYFYYLRYLSAVIAVCGGQWGFGPEDLAMVKNDGPSRLWVIGFLIGLAPVLFTRRSLLPGHAISLGFFDVCAMITLIDPASTITECPINSSGNHQDFYGAFVNYDLCYVALSLIFYAVLVVDVLLRLFTLAGRMISRR